MKLLITAGALALALSIAGPASSAEFKVGDLTVINPWARATAGKPRNGGAYLTIKGGASDDELTKVETAVAKRAQLHGHKNVDGVMVMQALKGLKVPAGRTVMLKPSIRHIMLMKLKQALKKGESFPMTLHFAQAGKVTVEVMIMGVGARNAGMKRGKMKPKE